ncbi:MAG: hypothetical protein WD042_08320 [Phycisphaeraceae bacterium]
MGASAWRGISKPLRWGRAVIDDLAPTTRAIALQQDGAANWSPDDAASYCWRCGATAGPGAVTTRGCPHCFGQKPAWDRLTRLGAYQAPLSDWIIAMKFVQDWSWAIWFGDELAQRIKPTGPSAAPAAVCPVPMHLWRRWRRGYNQADLMAQAFARRLRLPMLPLLRRSRLTPPQTRIAPSHRPANVRDSFAAPRYDLAGWTIWLVDDVKTSGSTVAACAKLLRQRGAAHIHVAVAAVADPKHADFKTL